MLKMSNILKTELQQSILVLNRQGWRNRRIARELGIDPRTVKRYAESKCANRQIDPEPLRFLDIKITPNIQPFVYSTSCLLNRLCFTAYQKHTD